MPVLEGKRMILFIAPKKTAASKKTEAANENADEETEVAKPVKRAPQVKAKKEYSGPYVEGEDF